MRSVSDRQKQTKVEDKMVWKAGFWAHSETVKKWWKVIGSCSEVNRHVRMKVAERGGWVIWIGGIVIDVGSSFQRLDEACCVFGVCFFQQKRPLSESGGNIQWLWATLYSVHVHFAWATCVYHLFYCTLSPQSHICFIADLFAGIRRLKAGRLGAVAPLPIVAQNVFSISSLFRFRRHMVRYVHLRKVIRADTLSKFLDPTLICNNGKL